MIYGSHYRRVQSLWNSIIGDPKLGNTQQLLVCYANSNQKASGGITICNFIVCG